MLGLLNDSMLGLMCSIGHQTGLFDAMEKLPASTSTQIAKAAKLNERYVREWLGSMVTGNIVDYAPKSQTYKLAPEHAAFLTRAAGQNNLAFFASYISVLGDVEQKVIKSFKTGGGVPYSEYPRFQAVQGEESAMLYDNALIPVVLPMAPGLVEWLMWAAARDMPSTSWQRPFPRAPLWAMTSPRRAWPLARPRRRSGSSRTPASR
jgi:hypothetical protein